MKSTSENTIALPVHGMTCSGCASHVQEAIQKLPGVSQVEVILGSRLANIVYDPNQVDLVEFHHAVIEAGYRIPTGEATLNVQGMSCMSCVSHVQGALEDLPGVLEATVNLANGTTQVNYIPDLVSTSQMKEALAAAGYPTGVAEVSSTPAQPQSANSPSKAGEQHNEGFVWRFKNLLRRN